MLLRNYQAIKLKEKFQKVFIKNTFFFMDLYTFFIKSIKYRLSQIVSGKNRVSYRLKDSNQGFYFEYLDSNNSY
jgi:hypothetical protein